MTSELKPWGQWVSGLGENWVLPTFHFTHGPGWPWLYFYQVCLRSLGIWGEIEFSELPSTLTLKKKKSPIRSKEDISLDFNPVNFNWRSVFRELVLCKLITKIIQLHNCRGKMKFYSLSVMALREDRSTQKIFYLGKITRTSPKCYVI